MEEKKEEKNVEKNVTNSTAIFFTWHWLTKYTFSSINRTHQAPKKL